MAGRFTWTILHRVLTERKLPRRHGDAEMPLGQATSCCFATLVPDRRAFVLNVYLQYELLRVE